MQENESDNSEHWAAPLSSLIPMIAYLTLTLTPIQILCYPTLHTISTPCTHQLSQQVNYADPAPTIPTFWPRFVFPLIPLYFFLLYTFIPPGTWSLTIPPLNHHLVLKVEGGKIQLDIRSQFPRTITLWCIQPLDQHFQLSILIVPHSQDLGRLHLQFPIFS